MSELEGRQGLRLCRLVRNWVHRITLEFARWPVSVVFWTQSLESRLLAPDCVSLPQLQNASTHAAPNVDATDVLARCRRRKRARKCSNVTGGQCGHGQCLRWRDVFGERDSSLIVLMMPKPLTWSGSIEKTQGSDETASQMSALSCCLCDFAGPRCDLKDLIQTPESLMRLTRYQGFIHITNSWNRCCNNLARSKSETVWCWLMFPRRQENSVMVRRILAGANITSKCGEACWICNHLPG